VLSRFRVPRLRCKSEDAVTSLQLEHVEWPPERAGLAQCGKCGKAIRSGVIRIGTDHLIDSDPLKLHILCDDSETSCYVDVRGATIGSEVIDGN